MVSERGLRALIVYAHPEPTSFCGAMKEVATAALRPLGVTVEVSDLYAEGFNPVAGRHDFSSVQQPERFHYQTEQLHAAATDGFAPDIMREQARVARADLLLFVFPLWWGGVPAILKGWFDRVLAYGFAYSDGKRYDEGYFRGRRGLLGISTGGTQHRFTANGAYGEMSSVLHGVQHCMLEYLGLDTADPFVAYAVPRVTQQEREHYLQQWHDRVQAMCADEAWRQERLSCKSDLPSATGPGAQGVGAWEQRH